MRIEGAFPLGRRGCGLVACGLQCFSRSERTGVRPARCPGQSMGSNPILTVNGHMQFSKQVFLT